MIGERMSRPPAPLYEGVRFAVKDMMHHKPYATHMPWHMPPSYEIKVCGRRPTVLLDRMESNRLVIVEAV
jgi:hypothetical protein